VDGSRRSRSPTGAAIVSDWLLAPSEEPAANLARLILRSAGAEIPVDIEEMIRDVADLSIETWPYDCDALVIGLLSPGRPTVFLKNGLHRRRRRFTLAHEFGHVAMEWHIGEIGCKPIDDANAFAIEELKPAESPHALLARERIAEQEAEATRFAAYLLMPDAFLRPLLAAKNLGIALHEANALDVSGTALIMRLRAMLQPGFLFHLSGPSGERTLTSSGTVLPVAARRTDSVDLDALAKIARATGSQRVAKDQVTWFRLAEFAEFAAVPDESRTSTEILREVIAQHVPDESARSATFRSLNGVAGGSLSKVRAQTPVQALSILRHKFETNAATSIVADAEFDVYLRRKVEEWDRKRSTRDLDP
jgi:Zn-dependent peptidase ImmA (M78 family)